MWQQWVNLILGIVIIATPFLNLSEATFTWLLVIVGIVVAGLSLWGAQETQAEREHGKMVHRTQS